MLNTIQKIQKTIASNLTEIESLYELIEVTKDTEKLHLMKSRIDILIGENRGYKRSLSFIKQDMLDVQSLIDDIDPRIKAL